MKTSSLLLPITIYIITSSFFDSINNPVFSKPSTTLNLTSDKSGNFQMLPCNQEVKLKSKNGKAININFINNTENAVRLYWLDFTGKRVQYSNNLPVSVTHQQPSFVGHPWMVTDLNDKCLGIYLFSNSTDVNLKQSK